MTAVLPLFTRATRGRTTAVTVIAHDAPMSFVIVAADHPSLEGDIDRFLDQLRSEPRYFGPRGAANPKPFPSLIDALAQRDRFRLASVECGRIVGVARVDGRGELFVAVVAERRQVGIGTALCRAALQRAGELGIETVVLRSTQRSKAAHRLCSQLGCVAVDDGRGGRDLILAADPVRYLPRSA